MLATWVKTPYRPQDTGDEQFRHANISSNNRNFVFDLMKSSLVLSHRMFQLTDIFTWMNSREGKMNRMLSSDWLPQQARWVHFAQSLTISCVDPARKRFPFGHFIKCLLAKLVRPRWLDTLLASFLFAFLLTSTSSRSIKTHAQKKLVNIQPSWSHPCQGWPGQ